MKSKVTKAKKKKKQQPATNTTTYEVRGRYVTEFEVRVEATSEQDAMEKVKKNHWKRRRKPAGDHQNAFFYLKPFGAQCCAPALEIIRANEVEVFGISDGKWYRISNGRVVGSGRADVGPSPAL